MLCPDSRNPQLSGSSEEPLQGRLLCPVSEPQWHSLPLGLLWVLGTGHSWSSLLKYFCVWLNRVITGTRTRKQEWERHQDTIKLYRDMLFSLTHNTATVANWPLSRRLRTPQNAEMAELNGCITCYIHTKKVSIVTVAWDPPTDLGCYSLALRAGEGLGEAGTYTPLWFLHPCRWLWDP